MNEPSNAEPLDVSQLNLSVLEADLLAAAARYEKALREDDLEELNALFAPAQTTLRAEAGGALVGHEQVAAHRRRRAGAPRRWLRRVHVRWISPDDALTVSETERLDGGSGVQTSCGTAGTTAGRSWLRTSPARYPLYRRSRMLLRPRTRPRGGPSARASSCRAAAPADLCSEYGSPSRTSSRSPDSASEAACRADCSWRLSRRTVLRRCTPCWPPAPRSPASLEPMSWPSP
ncbi:AtzH-like domain-containing protein [Kineococcus sp. SYSU DK006]|uniref:AtzH-like domain-containing protein n=1 Tax=Kineococcus sp. SYSU DK006 TaxID=3383127 RepID=UPI003D7D02A6